MPIVSEIDKNSRKIITAFKTHQHTSLSWTR